ncbi:MAG: ATP-binding protein, partial [Kiritimatiellaeota bacterium]|nr:ATP-binding protein [Kiritimatiellota bacterium]
MPTLLTGYMALLVMLTATAFSIFFYRFSRDNLLAQIDEQLLAAAYFTKAALPADFHDQLRDAKSLAPAEYAKIVERHNQLCIRLGMQYLWSCLMTGGDIVFTTATSPGKDVRKGDHAKFFDVHRDPHSYDRVFGRMTVDYSSFHNEWGHGRMVLVPFRDAHGRPYCFGASMSVEDVFAAQHKLLLHTVTLGMGALAVGLLGTLLLARLLSRPIRDLTLSAERITRGDLADPVAVAGPAEVGQLAEALNTMRLAIADKINALSRREEDQRLLLQNLSAAVVIHAPDTHIIYSNPMASTLLGLTAEQMQGKEAIDPAWSFVHDDGTPMPLDDYPVNRVLATRQSLVNYLLGINRPGRPERTWVLVNAFPEYEKDGALRQVVVTFVDVTTIKRLERQLLQAQKMEAIGQLAGGVAHDFNNILQAINGYTELAQTDTSAEHPAQESLTEIAKAAERAGKLVGQLLAFSRRQILEPAHLDLNDVVGNLIGMLGRVIGEHIRLDFIPGHQLGTVRADRTMVEQVLLNLSVNARDAMSRSGRLTIETENVCFDNDYCAQNLWAHPGRYVLLSVTDTGCGMDATTLEHIFEPFFTTKDTGKGTGLGLSMVYGIVRQHEGMVRVYSEVGKGTNFKIYL